MTRPLNSSSLNISARISLFAVVALALLVAAVIGYRLASPEIVVTNRSSSRIDEIVIQLPSSRVSFDAIEPGASSTIFYSVDQVDGVCKYVAKLDSGRMVDGQCGHVTNSQYGKRIELTILITGEVEHREDNKIF